MEIPVNWEGIDLEDSWVLGWHHDREHGQLVFKIDTSLWPGHPDYEQPLPNEYTCYKHGELIFDEVIEVNGLPRMDDARPNIDPDGTLDYGNIEGLRRSQNGTYNFTIELHDISVRAGAVRLEIRSPQPSAT